MADIGKHGGHDAGAILEVHPFLRPIDVYRKHVEGWQQEQTERMQEGNIFEAPILRLYAERTGAEMGDGGLRVHPSIPWAVASLDATALREGAWRAVDAKHPSIFTMREWDAAEGGLPLYVTAQMQWYLGVTGMVRADVAVYFGGGAFRVETVEADAELFGQMVERVAKFRRDHIEAMRPPPVDGSESYADFLREKFPSSNGEMLEPTADAIFLVERLAEMKQKAKLLEETERAARNELLALLGGADGVRGLCTYRQTKGRATTDWKAVCAEAGVSKELIEQFTTRAPYRVLRLSKGGSNE